MDVRVRAAAGGAAAALIGALLTGGQPAAAAPGDQQLHNVTYTARVDGIAPGTVVTFMLNDQQTTSTDLDKLPGQAFQASTVLSDPTRAGMMVRLRWPSSANVHCEIKVDSLVAVKVDRYVSTWASSDDPFTGTLVCGAPLTGMA